MAHKRSGRSRMQRKAARQANAAQKGDEMKVTIETDDDVITPDEIEEPTPEDAADPADVADTAPDDATADAASDDAETPDAMTEEELVAAAIAAGDAAAADDFKAELEAVRKERDELRAQIEAEQSVATDAADRLARLQADWENFRRRTAAERLAERDRATEKLVTNLLPAIDDLERACAHASETTDNEQLTSFASGVSAVRDKILSILAREGVEQIDAADAPFDPLKHQAVGRVEDAEAYDETVRDVYQAGYTMAGRVLRPAMVTVTFGGPKRPVEEPEATE